MRCFIVSFSLCALVFVTCRAKAEEPHASWLKFMTGTWDITWKLSDGTPIKSTSTISLAADGNAVLGEGVLADGSKTVGLTGWQSDTKTLLQVGYGRNGQYWTTRFRKIEEDRMSGSGNGVLPDGRTYKGRYVATRKVDDAYEMQFTGTTGDEELTAHGTFIRKRVK